MTMDTNNTSLKLRLHSSLSLYAVFAVLMAAPAIAQKVDDLYKVKPTPALPGVADDHTTVLLVSKDAGRVADSHGRFLSIRPEVGLLTSTARTFIQEGITTEYATQILGRILDNGQVYAQYLKKSSRILFENGQVTPSVVTSWVGEVDSSHTRLYLQNHNDLFNADAPDWQDIDDHLVAGRGEFVGNTDFVSVQRATVQEPYVSKVIGKGAIQTTSTLELLLSNLVSDGKFATRPKQQAYHIDASIVPSEKVSSVKDLATYTIKNYFEPSGFMFKGANDTAQDKQVNLRISRIDEKDESRSPKVYYQQLMNDHSDIKANIQTSQKLLPLQKRVLPSVTYYGFAEFTTVVGDSVIVFSPSTSQSNENFGHVTSIKGKATLSESFNKNSLSVKASIIPTKTSEATRIKYTYTAEVSNLDFKDRADISKSIDNNEFKIYTSQVYSDALYRTIDSKLNSIQNETVTTRPKTTNAGNEEPMYSLPTEEEILQIYASLSKVQAPTSILNTAYSSNNRITGRPENSQMQLESNIEIRGGATTIFFEDDPFINFVEPTVIQPTPTSSMSLNETKRIIQSGFDETIADEISTISNGSDGLTTMDDEGIEVTDNITISGLVVNNDESDNTNNCTKIIEVCVSTAETLEATKYLGIQGTESLQLNQLNNTEEPQIENPMISRITANLNDIAIDHSKNNLILSTMSSISTDTSTEFDDITTELINEKNEKLTDYDIDNEEYDMESGSGDSDLIYKKFFTTYTYLTTFFRGDLTTVSSHTEIVTNIITSTVDSVRDYDTDPTKMVNLTRQNELSAALSENSIIKATATDSKYMIPNDLASLIEVVDSDAPEEIEKYVSNSGNASYNTNFLDDFKHIKTYFTTYTYYTTIFEGSETEIDSRTEVLTNFATETKQLNIDATPIFKSTTSFQGYPPFHTPDAANTFLLASDSLPKDANTDNKFNKENYVTLVSDVRSISLNGEKKIISKYNDLVDDQVSSESNTEEIVPSATLLLQTSFTTFTFYTTMYVGDDTNVISRLDTITNVVTEILQPTKTLNVEEVTLPITYFTTFTYWTKLAKDGEITTISREETISNVIDPTRFLSNTVGDLSASINLPNIPIIDIKSAPSDLEQFSDDNVSNQYNDTRSEININNKEITSRPSDLTTYYTTYTYYTTSYESNKTIIDSRLETITSLVTPVSTSIEKLSTTIPLSSFDSTKGINSSAMEICLNTSSLILYDYKQISDAEGVSTLHFTTKVFSVLNEANNSIEVTSSTSSLFIDDKKKSNLPSPIANATSEGDVIQRQYKTGLVRLIEGTRIGNSTTTLYQSKVIGTIIENRYAQIIESTSSFLFKTTNELTDFQITPTISPKITDNIILMTRQVNLLSDISFVESSINDRETTEGIDLVSEEESDTEIDGNSNKSPIQFQGKKSTFAPVIRPFASRNRPIFAPKQKTATPSSATIITRTDVTPTITATPALKSVGKYNSLKKGVISNIPINPNENLSTRRTFGRPNKSPFRGSSGLSSSSQTRNRFASSSRITPNIKRITASFRPSSGIGFRSAFSSSSFGNSRVRIKPTGSADIIARSSLIISNADDSAEENFSQEHINTEEETTTESPRRSQNPLLRFRRPINRPSGFSLNSRPTGSTLANITPKRNPLTARAKTLATTSSTTTAPKTSSRNFQRPSNFQRRSRPSNSLFPPRGLFQSQSQLHGENAGKELENDSEYEDDAEDEGDAETNRRKRSSKKLKKSENRSRARRQAETAKNQSLNRNRFRFRRPKISTFSSTEEVFTNIEETSEVTPLSRNKINSRFGSKYHPPQSQTTSSAVPTSHRSIRPTRPTSFRTQFTLREKDSSSSKGLARPSSFRRQQPSSVPQIRRNSASSSSTNRRLKSYIGHNSNTNNNNIETSGWSSSSRSRNNNLNSSMRGRGNPRTRNRNGELTDPLAVELGSATITVTHIIPAEVNIPVINGQITEYKNIITAKTSTEVVGPQQYINSVGNNGQTTLFLSREDSSINYSGATEITKYQLHDSTTTTVTFTPTTIRGRKTSFSHILPSTVYTVENVVSTIQPQISANAPLANILLSQLLLGNINLPANQLLGGLGAPAVALTQQNSPIVSSSSVQFTPVTEYRTHTSTYVTTIFDGKSTVLPVTFQGKKIFTTVYDTTAQTITATEYSVDTILTTPTQVQQQLQSAGHAVQVNNLLLQQLLLQQHQSLLEQPQNNSHTLMPQIFLMENLQDLDAHTGKIAGFNRNVDNIDQIDGLVPLIEDAQQNKATRKKSRKSNKSHKRNKQHHNEGEHEPAFPKDDSSIITLYVSGRRPGEFSTILSTLQNSFDLHTSLHKRQVYHSHTHYAKPTDALNEPQDLYISEGSENMQQYLWPFDSVLNVSKFQSNDISGTINEVEKNALAIESKGLKIQTASLESIVGDVDLWYTRSTKQMHIVPPVSITNTFLTIKSNSQNHSLV